MEWVCAQESHPDQECLWALGWMAECQRQRELVWQWALEQGLGIRLDGMWAQV